MEFKTKEQTEVKDMENYILAANYSKELLELISEAPAIVSAVKVSEFGSTDYLDDYKELRRQKNVFLHGLVQSANLGEPGFRQMFNAEILKKTLELTDTRYISCHLQCNVPYGEHVDRDVFLDRFISDSMYVKELMNMPVHLENVHFNFAVKEKMNKEPFVSEPDFIKEALVKTNSKFLLDIGHAQVAAWHLNMEPERYIHMLPLDLVEEIHITGPVMVDGELRDKHHEVSEEGYSLLKYVLENSNANTVTLEYGGVGKTFEDRSDKETLKRQLLRLRELLTR